MTKRTVFPLALLTALLPSTAWACGPTGSELLLLGFLGTSILTFPYALLTSIVAAANAKKWFERPRRGWILTTVRAVLVSIAGAAAGVSIAGLADSVAGNAAQIVIAFSTPLVFQIAYIMRLHSRRFVRD